jgi:hypothetical protein
MARENPESAFAHIETKLEEGEGSIRGLGSSTYPWIADTGVCNRVRWTSAQSKRVATNNDRTRSMVSHEHPKKRAALTNLTNQSHLVSTTTMIDVSILENFCSCNTFPHPICLIISHSLCPELIFVRVYYIYSCLLIWYWVSCLRRYIIIYTQN